MFRNQPMICPGIPAKIYLFNVTNNGNTIKGCQICSKLMIKIPAIDFEQGTVCWDFLKRSDFNTTFVFRVSYFPRLISGQCSYSILPGVLKQKGESQNRCFKKTKHAKFSEKRTFLTP